MKRSIIALFAGIGMAFTALADPLFVVEPTFSEPSTSSTWNVPTDVGPLIDTNSQAGPENWPSFGNKSDFMNLLVSDYCDDHPNGPACCAPGDMTCDPGSGTGGGNGPGGNPIPLPDPEEPEIFQDMWSNPVANHHCNRAYCKVHRISPQCDGCPTYPPQT